METTLERSPVGRLWVPELTRFTFLPGRSAGRPESRRYIGVVTYEVRDGRGRKTQAGHGLGVRCDEGIVERWNRFDTLQRLYPTPESMIQALEFRSRYGNVALPSGIVNNERVNNGGKMEGAAFFVTSAAPSNATINAPNRIALCNLSSFAAAAGDLSLGTATMNVTTNEVTTNGLGRTSAITPTSIVDQSVLDGQEQDSLVNTFTDATATTDTYGTALMDNTTTAFNMFGEASYTHAITNVGDTLLITWTRKY